MICSLTHLARRCLPACWLAATLVVLPTSAVAQQTTDRPQAETGETGQQPADGPEAAQRPAAAEQEEGGDDAAAEPAGQAPQETNYRYWTSNWSFEQIDIGRLTSRLARIGFELPIELAGEATVRFDVSIPLNGLRQAQAYRFQGTLFSNRLKVDELTFDNLSAELRYVDGKLTVSRLRGDLREGTFTGQATAGVVPREDFTATLDIERIDIGPIAEILTQFEVIPADRTPTGQIDGRVELAGDVNDLGDPSQWSVEGRGEVRQLSIGDSPPFTVSADSFTLRDEQVSIPSMTARSSEIPEFRGTLSAEVQLREPGRFDIAVMTNDLPTAAVAQLWVDQPTNYVAGKVDLRGTATGVLQGEGERAPTGESLFRIDLDVASPSLRVFRVDLGLLEHHLEVTPEQLVLTPLREDTETLPPAVRVQSIRADYQIDEQRIAFREVLAEAFGGRLEGSASLARQEDGRHTVDANWNDLSPSIRFPVGGTNFRPELTGVTSGQIEWSVPADEVTRPAAHDGTAAVTIEELRLGQEPIGNATAEVAIDQQELRASGEGQLLGGRVAFETRSDLAVSATWDELFRSVLRGELNWESISLGRLERAATGNQSPAVSGLSDGSLQWTANPDGTLETSSRVTVRQLAVWGTPISRQLIAELQSEGDQLELRSLRGSYAGGQVQASGRWSLSRGGGAIDARLVGAEGSRMLLPLSPTAEDWIGGRVSARGTLASIGNRPLDGLRLRGSVRVRNGVAAGTPLGDAHSPIYGVFRPATGNWQVSFPRVRSQLAGGSLNGEASLASARSGRSGLQLDSQWRANRVDFERLLDTYAGGSTIGRGNISGDLRLVGDEIRGVEDLRGDFRARLGATDATAVPGLSAAGSLLGAVSLAGIQFTEGQLVGSLARGAVRVRELWLRGDRMRAYAEGRVGLQDTRMDLQAVVSTGNFEAQNAALALLVERAIVPLSVVTTINRVASDRTVVFDLSGTLSNPQVRLLAVPSARATARQTLIRETVGIAIPESLLLGRD